MMKRHLTPQVVYWSRTRHVRLLSADVEAIFDRPTWSTATLLENQDKPAQEIDLDHLHKLSALPCPKDANTRERLVKSLEDQLRFVQAIQRIDTANVEPLTSIVANQATALSYEEMSIEEDVSSLESKLKDADYLTSAARRRGRFYIVDGGLVTKPA